MDYKHQRIECEEGKVIDVFDNVFPMRWRDQAYDGVKKSLFRIGWGEDETGEKTRYDQHIHSIYTPEEFNSTGMLEYITKVPEIQNEISKLQLDTIVVNCTTVSDVHLLHTHPSKKVLLYYVNLNWEENFFGETQFWSEDKTSIQFSSPYVPGRLVMFDSTIPHTIRPQSITAPKFRFTMAIQYS